jgi:hypothetical protein
MNCVVQCLVSSPNTVFYTALKFRKFTSKVKETDLSDK